MEKKHGTAAQAEAALQPFEWEKASLSYPKFKSRSTSHDYARALSRGFALPARGCEPRSESQPPIGKEFTRDRLGISQRSSRTDRKESMGKTNSKVHLGRTMRKRYGLIEFLKDEFVSHPGANPNNRVDEESQAKHSRGTVYSMIELPLKLERLIVLGSFACLDAFLALLTTVPLRLFGFVGSSKYVYKPISTDTSIRQQALVMTLSCLLLHTMNISVSGLYHSVRGQTFFKLYVFFNILTTVEKLCAAVGEDVMQAFVYDVSVRGRVFSYILETIGATFYVCTHAIVLSLQIVTLNVSINSSSSTLVTLLVSNNFIELKSSAFKRYTKQSLFQICCSDMVERFQLICFVCIIVASNLSTIAWTHASKWLWQASQLMVLLFSMEMIVDWTKHAFITKFNRISLEVYRQFGTVLRVDLVATRVAGLQTQVPISDRTQAISSNEIVRTLLEQGHNVSQRLGFVPMPLACIIIRGTIRAISSSFVTELPFPIVLAGGLLLFACLILLKLMIAIILIGVSIEKAINAPACILDYQHVDRYRLFETAIPSA